MELEYYFTLLSNVISQFLDCGVSIGCIRDNLFNVIGSNNFFK